MQTDVLNELLCTLEVAYANAKGRHWTVYGTKFRSMHLLLDDTAQSLREGADKVAETVRVLGDVPFHTLSSFVRNSHVEEAKTVPDAFQMAIDMRNDLNVVVDMVHAGVKAKSYDPTTENDVLNITSTLRHWILFYDGIISNWDTEPSNE